MNKYIIPILIVVLLLSSGFVGVSYSIDDIEQSNMLTFSDGNILYVGGSGPGNYTTIQGAIDDSEDGDTVFVYNGTYYENVVVDKSINLMGENRETTIIDGGDSGDVVNVSVDFVYIGNFTIQNGESSWDFAGININADYIVVADNRIFNNGYGILNEAHSNLTAKNNIIKENFGNGIGLRRSFSNILSNNTIEHCHFGIGFYKSTFNTLISNIVNSNSIDGVFLQSSNNNTFISNIVSNNNESGICLYYHSNNTTLISNTVNNNLHHGIIVYPGLSNTTIISNIVKNNVYSGISLSDDDRDNILYHNNLINNNHRDAYDPGNNTWDNGYPSGGNYYSDYDGIDADGDGIGDTPYYIPGGDSVDRYPLIEPYGDDIVPPTTLLSYDPLVPDGDNGWYVSNVNVTLDAIDPSGVKVSYYRINGGEWEMYECPFVISEDGCFMIEYYSVDNVGNVEDVKSSGLFIDQTPPETSLAWEAYKKNCAWYVKITLIADDATSGIDRLEFYINEGLQDIIIDPGPEYVFILKWSRAFKTLTFKFVYYDMAGNFAFELVNSSDIKSYPSSHSSDTQQSNYLWFLRWLERFPRLQWLMGILGWNVE